MITLSKKSIVVLGMMSRIPVAGNVWLVLHYLLGFRRLGYDVFYVEAHGRTPSMLMERVDDDGSVKATEFIGGVMRRFDLADCWAFHAVHDSDRCFGMSKTRLYDLYRTADLIINLHGGTVPLPEHYETGRLVYLETDPVQLEIELHQGKEKAFRLLEPHAAFFSWGENYGRADCGVPVSERFRFRPTRAPVICDLWQNGQQCGGAQLTTIGNWRQPWREVTFRGQVYHWSKHFEFLKFIELPRRVDQPFELALSSCGESDERMLDEHGWKVRQALPFSADLHAYRDYIRRSRGEFTVAKDQNVRLRSGWFSERSAQYLAAGRPVITQETGFSNALPTGQGLFAYENIEEAVQAVEAVNADYQRHCRAAAALAREYFNYDVVLQRLLSELGL